MGDLIHLSWSCSEELSQARRRIEMLAWPGPPQLERALAAAALCATTTAELVMVSILTTEPEKLSKSHKREKLQARFRKVDQQTKEYGQNLRNQIHKCILEETEIVTNFPRSLFETLINEESTNVNIASKQFRGEEVFRASWFSNLDSI